MRDYTENCVSFDLRLRPSSRSRTCRGFRARKSPKDWRSEGILLGGKLQTSSQEVLGHFQDMDLDQAGNRSRNKQFLGLPAVHFANDISVLAFCRIPIDDDSAIKCMMRLIRRFSVRDESMTNTSYSLGGLSSYRWLYWTVRPQSIDRLLRRRPP